jgi:uncharacterized membrane protein
MSKHNELSPENKFALERLIFFSDAVFAIAITLLALELRVPVMPQAQVASEMLSALMNMDAKFISFILSFVVIGVYWGAHHFDFQYIKRFDRGLLWLNLLVLFGVIFLPFPTAMIGSYPGQQITVSLYAASVAGLGLVRWAMWIYAARHHRLVDADLDPKFISRLMRRALIVPVVFILSIGIAAFNPALAMYSWWLIAPAYVLFR